MTTSDVPSASRLPDERSFRNVLFVCDHNAGRSQMAQALFERDAPEDLRAESAGTEPAAAIWPQVVEVMREVGLDLAGRKPNKLTLEMQLHADWAITMGCRDACPYVPAMVESWDRTAHQLRLARLLPMLAREFADTKPAEEIRACADAVLTGFDEARVRTHIMTLAHRQTRDCLRQDTCDLLATQKPS